MKIYNTLSGRQEDFIPLNKDKVGMYVCGMTVQDSPHIGHMRAYITSDIIKRWLEYKGFKVRHIQNFTDIDDKIIAKAKEEKCDFREIAEKHINEYMGASDRLGIKRADLYPRATEHIQEIIEIIEKLFENKIAYKTESGVYFEVKKFKSYGKLSKKNIKDLRAGARISPDEKKKSAFDFALWKAHKQGEPFWHSPWGEGRPGWHIECSAMSTHYLGETFDIHTGGEDLIFPHHENEIAQSEAATNKPFVKYWLHNGLLRLTGEKMSKSTHHFISTKELLPKYKADSVRLYLLSTHYRHPLEFEEARLKEAEESLRRIEEAIVYLKRDLPKEEKLKPNISILSFVEDFEKAMDEDFNTPKAIGIIYSFIKFINTENLEGIKNQVYSTLLKLCNVLGIYEKEEEVKFDKKLVDVIIDIRKTSRNKGEFGLGDEIRKRLSELNIYLSDQPDGTTIWRVR